MKFFLFCSLFIFTSCTNAQRLRPRVDQELIDYREEFNKLVNVPRISKRLKKTEIYFDDLEKEKKQLIGHCSNWDINYSVVRIDSKYWQQATPMSKQFTVYHELSHCACLRMHTQESSGWQGFFEKIAFALGIATKKGYLKDGCPASLMHPSDFSEECMLRHYYYYLKELKKGCQ